MIWVNDAVQRSIQQGVPETRKDVSTFTLRQSVAREQDQSIYFSEAEDYTAAFERRATRKRVDTTRPYSNDEMVQLYLIALYSSLIEPSDLAKAGLSLLGEEASSVAFSSEDGESVISVSEAVATDETIEQLRQLLEPEIKHVS